MDATTQWGDGELLIQRFFEHPNNELREEILAHYAPTVERIARKYAGIEPQEDLAQVGYIGLLNAIKKFDLEAGVRFNTYASHLIAGEIKHYLRDKSQTIRHPAWLQELRHKIVRTQLQLTGELGRTPTSAEVSAASGVAESSVIETLAAAELAKVTSYDATMPGEDDSNELDNFADPLTAAFNFEDRIVLENAMNQLRDLERDVVMRFHFDAMSQTEIARELDISCNYVSHILRQSMSKLRRILTNEEASEQRLQKKAGTPEDGIVNFSTGIYQEKYFHSRVGEEVHRALASDHSVAIILIRFDGLDGFAGFYGRESVGDFMADAGELLRDSVRRLDILCAYGKNGFGIVLPFTGATAAVVHERIMTRLKPWLQARRSPAGVIQANVGFAYLHDSVKSPKQLIASATAMMDTESTNEAERPQAA